MAEQAVAIARANAVLVTRKVVLADADRVTATWNNPIKRDPFEVPLETKIAFLMKLNETAMAVKGVSFVNSQLLFVDEQKYFASSEGSRITQRLVRTYPQFTVTAADRASRRLPDAPGGRSRAAPRLRIRGGLPVAARRREGRPRGGREAQGEAHRPRPLRHRRRSVAAVPGDPRVGGPLDGARPRAGVGGEHRPAPASSSLATPASSASATPSSTWWPIARSPAASPRWGMTMKG